MWTIVFVSQFSVYMKNSWGLQNLNRQHLIVHERNKNFQYPIHIFALIIHVIYWWSLKMLDEKRIETVWIELTNTMELLLYVISKRVILYIYYLCSMIWWHFSLIFWQLIAFRCQVVVDLCFSINLWVNLIWNCKLCSGRRLKSR